MATFLALVGYYAIALFIFRTGYLRMKDSIQRKFPSCEWGSISDYKKQGVVLIPSLVAAIWPLALAGFLIYKAMFPRGIKTKFDKEQEQKKGLEQAERDLAQAKELLRRERINFE